MARINIEDSFWIDIMGVVAKLGDQDRAIGQALRFIKFAQEKHRNGCLITEAEFEENGFSTALFGSFAKIIRSKAEAESSTIEAKGAEKHFTWLDAKIEAGRRGGLSKSEAKTKHLKQNRTEAKPKQTEAKPKQTEAKASKTEASSSSFPSLRISEELNTSYLGAVGSDTPNEIIPFEVRNPTGFFISKYREAFKTRYGCDPDVRGKVQGQIKNLLKDYPLMKAVHMVQAYCQMNGHKDWFKTRGHDFGTFIENLNPIAIAISNGSESSRPKTIAEILAEEERENAAARI